MLIALRALPWFAWGCACASLASGCVSYHAPLQTKVQRGELDVVVESVSGQAVGDSRVVLSLRAVPEGSRLLDASIRAPDGAPCGEGLYATAWGRSSGEKHDQPLVAGETISLALPSEALEALAKHPSRLDLSLRTAQGEPRCIPIPISDEPDGLELEPSARFTASLEFGLEGFPNRLGSVQQIISFPLVLGAWIDRVHAKAGAGLLGAGCPDTLCPIDDGSESKIDYSHGYTLLAGADTVLWEAGEIGVGLGLHYRAALLSADTFAGQNSEEFWMHGPVLAPAFLVVMPVLKPHSIGGSRVGQIAFEVPIGYAITSDHGSSVSLGFALRFRFTVL
jgi:hypothetical protein